MITSLHTVRGQDHLDELLLKVSRNAIDLAWSIHPSLIVVATFTMCTI